MAMLAGIARSQLFHGQPTTTKPYKDCTPFKLPSQGIIAIAADYTITLAADAVFTPLCTSGETSQVEGEDSGGVTSVTDMKDPFHASITPQAYATGAATVIAWMLVIMLLITPRTFFVGGASGRSGLMGRRGMISGATGGGSIIGVGTRPWLQKVAALTVAVSMTLATADTFKIAERQYEEGFMDAMTLRNEVVSGMEIKVSRLISDVFLWLAQVQTLIRLFPRHKEKVIIKWVGFALILLDITFSSLNSFGPYDDSRRPSDFKTAIPALSYLFQLSLSMLYAAWVIYYAITKRRYAFYHSMMWNISLVALLSIVAILTPVVFFITDISNYSIAGWGDYFRWVGAAAASVIVWEWVERIEALEREERKDGILGREIYDGDEMLDTTPSHEIWPQRQSYNSGLSKKPGDDKDEKGGGSSGIASGALGASITLSNLAHRFGRSRHQAAKESSKTKRTIHIPAPAPVRRRSDPAQRDPRTYLPISTPPPPQVPQIASPVSRTDTTSADSTVYTIRYHPISTTPANNATTNNRPPTSSHQNPNSSGIQPSTSSSTSTDPEKALELTLQPLPIQNRNKWNWQAVPNPFRRRGRSPPPEVQRGQVIEPLAVDDVSANIPPRNYAGLALKDRLGTFAAQQGERFRSKRNGRDGNGGLQQPEVNLPVTIIPAQPRGRTWSPEILMQGDESGAGSEVTLRERIPGARSGPTDTTDSRVSSSEGEGGDAPSAVPTASSTRQTHIRFAPAPLGRPDTATRAQSSATNRGPSTVPPPPLTASVALGTETRDFQPQPQHQHQHQTQREQEDSPPTPQPPPPPPPPPPPAVAMDSQLFTNQQNQIPTNHDR